MEDVFFGNPKQFGGGIARHNGEDLGRMGQDGQHIGTIHCESEDTALTRRISFYLLSEDTAVLSDTILS